MNTFIRTGLIDLLVKAYEGGEPLPSVFHKHVAEVVRLRAVARASFRAYADAVNGAESFSAGLAATDNTTVLRDEALLDVAYGDLVRAVEAGWRYFALGAERPDGVGYIRYVA
jgi:hypothetical protein